MKIPQNIELEQAVIGAALLNKSIPWAARELSVTEFSGVNRSIWAAICELDEDRLPVDVFAVHDRIPNPLTTVSEMMKMTVGVPMSFPDDRDVKSLKEYSALRILQKGFQDLVDNTQTKTPSEDLIGQAESLLSGVRQARFAEQGTSRLLSEVYERDVFPRLDRYVSGDLVKIPFGWTPLDNSTNGGCLPGELVIFGAKPKSGKSAWLIQLARYQAEQNIGCYVVSREMLNYENAFRIIAQKSNYSVNHFRSGLYAETAEKLKSLARETGGVPMFMDDKGKTVDDIRRELDRIEHNGYDIKSVFVDYVQLMRDPRKYGSAAEMYERIIYDLKDLATEREVVVYVNAQFNREGISSERPKMSDFKGSSAIEMAGNLILFWTLEQNVDAEAKGRKGKLWIEAGRNVAYDEFKIVFKGEKASFHFM